MTSVNAFNSLFQQFLDELSKVFPEEKKLAMYAKQFPLLCAANPQKAMEVFSNTFGPYADKIQRQDETLVDDVPMLFDEIDIRKIWKSGDQATRDAMWKYLQNLNFLATTINLIPPDMMNTIESIAQSCADKIQSGQLDPSSILSMLPQVMQSLGGMNLGPK
jgi:hypothetical protein